MGAGWVVDPDRDEARRWLEDELSRPEYAVRESLLLRAWAWITDHLPSLSLPGALPPWAAWALLGVVLLAATLVVIASSRDRRRQGSLSTAGRSSVLDEVGVPAAEYRRRADAATAAGDHGTALLEAYRAIAAGAVERALTEDRPGRTAHEVALELAPVFPAEAAALAEAADAFDAVRYGGLGATADRAARVRQLESRIARARPVLDDAAVAR